MLLKGNTSTKKKSKSQVIHNNSLFEEGNIDKYCQHLLICISPFYLDFDEKGYELMPKLSKSAKLKVVIEVIKLVLTTYSSQDFGVSWVPCSSEARG